MRRAALHGKRGACGWRMARAEGVRPAEEPRGHAGRARGCGRAASRPLPGHVVQPARLRGRRRGGRPRPCDRSAGAAEDRPRADPFAGRGAAGAVRAGVDERAFVAGRRPHVLGAGEDEKRAALQPEAWGEGGHPGQPEPESRCAREHLGGADGRPARPQLQPLVRRAERRLGARHADLERGRRGALLHQHAAVLGLLQSRPAKPRVPPRRRGRHRPDRLPEGTGAHVRDSPSAHFPPHADQHGGLERIPPLHAGRSRDERVGRRCGEARRGRRPDGAGRLLHEAVPGAA